MTGFSPRMVKVQLFNWSRLSLLLFQPLVNLHYVWAVWFCLHWEMHWMLLAKMLVNQMSGTKWVS